MPQKLMRVSPPSKVTKVSLKRRVYFWHPPPRAAALRSSRGSTQTTHVRNENWIIAKWTLLQLLWTISIKKLRCCTILRARHVPLTPRRANVKGTSQRAGALIKDLKSWIWIWHNISAMARECALEITQCHHRGRSQKMRKQTTQRSNLTAKTWWPTLRPHAESLTLLQGVVKDLQHLRTRYKGGLRWGFRLLWRWWRITALSLILMVRSPNAFLAKIRGRLSGVQKRLRGGRSKGSVQLLLALTPVERRRTITLRSPLCFIARHQLRGRDRWSRFHRSWRRSDFQSR